MAIRKIRYQCENCLYEQMEDFKHCPKCCHINVPKLNNKIDIKKYYFPTTDIRK